MNTHIFIDGREGTTGLHLEQRLRELPGITFIDIDPALRKDLSARLGCYARADFAFICLPDAAAKEIADAAANLSVRILDASTAHRTNPGWLYGFPELGGRYASDLPSATRVAVPGCHATGFIALVYPLIQTGLLSADAALHAFSLTGYSGGGKAMIARYEDEARQPGDELSHPAMYALSLSHKHLPEMTAITGLTTPPVFTPIVCDHYSGMSVCVTLAAGQLPDGTAADDIHSLYTSFYAGQANINVLPADQIAPDGFLYSDGCNGANRIDIAVNGNADGQFALIARLDNMGKGSSGAAVQLFEVMRG